MSFNKLWTLLKKERTKRYPNEDLMNKSIAEYWKYVVNK